MRKIPVIYFGLGLLFVVMVVLQLSTPRPLNWSESYLVKDQNPYGASILFERLTDFFPAGKSASFRTLLELKDSVAHILVIGNTLDFNETDLSELFHRLESGGSVLLIGTQYTDKICDTLGFFVNTSFGESIPFVDTAYLEFQGKSVGYPKTLLSSSLGSDGDEWQYLAERDGDPVLMTKSYGKGKLLIGSCPLLFTNFGILTDHRFVGFTFNQLDGKIPLHYSLFYHHGKPQNKSPLRYVLSQGALIWAVYLSIAILLSFLILESRRRQRAIPIINPPENTTIHYIRTLGGLFYREGNNKEVAKKLTRHFFVKLKERYHKQPKFDGEYYTWLSKKTALKKSGIVAIFENIKQIEATHDMTDQRLKTIYKDISKFKLNQL